MAEKGFGLEYYYELAEELNTEVLRLRAVNAQLLEALKRIIEAKDAFHGGDLHRAIDSSRAVIEQAK